MNHDKLKEFSRVFAQISVGIEALFKAQLFLAEVMSKECDIPLEITKVMIEDMNNTIGVKKDEQ